MAKVGAGKCFECDKDVIETYDYHRCDEDGEYYCEKCMNSRAGNFKAKSLFEVRCCECNLDLTELAFETITLANDDGNESKMCKGCYFAKQMVAHFEEVSIPKGPNYYVREIYVELYLANDIEYLKLMIDLEPDDTKKELTFKELGEHMHEMRKVNLQKAEHDGDNET